MGARRGWLAWVPGVGFLLSGLMALVRSGSLREAVPPLLAAAVGVWALRLGRAPGRVTRSGGGGRWQAGSALGGRWRSAGWLLFGALALLSFGVVSPGLSSMLSAAAGLIFWLLYPELAGWITLGSTVVVLALMGAVWLWGP